MLMTSRGIYGRRAGHRMPRRTLTSPLHLPLPMSILVQYPHGITRQEHASLSCAAGQRCMSLTCAAPSSSGIRRETSLVKRRACLLPRTVILDALSTHKRAAARRSILCRAASLAHSAMHYDTYCTRSGKRASYDASAACISLTCAAGDTSGRTGRSRVRACAAPTCISRQA
jgi:hypothetical protein